LNKARDQRVAEHHFSKMYGMLEMADGNMEGRIDRSFESTLSEEDVPQQNMPMEVPSRSNSSPKYWHGLDVAPPIPRFSRVGRPDEVHYDGIGDNSQAHLSGLVDNV
jgi:hypothetical protein